MASEEFICLGATCKADAKDEEEGNLQTESLRVNGVEPLASEHQLILFIGSRADKDDSRCFNCGSYNHALKECPQPRDNVAISNARKQHNSKRNQSNVNRGQNRYYQKTPGKFDDLRAGVLGPETRECLGDRENDPPPWLHRMRELGYPPGYLDVVDDEDKPSGITIFGDGKVKQEDEERELPEQGEPSPPRKRVTVEFPGINAPIPENSDRWLWGSTSVKSFGCKKLSVESFILFENSDEKLNF